MANEVIMDFSGNAVYTGNIIHQLDSTIKAAKAHKFPERSVLHPSGEYKIPESKHMKKIERERLKQERDKILSTYPKQLKLIKEYMRKYPHLSEQINQIAGTFTEKIYLEEGKFKVVSWPIGKNNRVEEQIIPLVKEISDLISQPPEFDSIVPSSLNFDKIEMNLEQILEDNNYKLKKTSKNSEDIHVSTKKLKYNTGNGKINYNVSTDGENIFIKYMAFSRPYNGEEYTDPKFEKTENFKKGIYGVLKETKEGYEVFKQDEIDELENIASLENSKLADKLDVVVKIDKKKNIDILHIEHQLGKTLYTKHVNRQIRPHEHAFLLNGIVGEEYKTFSDDLTTLFQYIKNNAEVVPVERIEFEELQNQKRYNVLCRNPDLLGGLNFEQIVKYVTKNRHKILKKYDSIKSKTQ